jgi:hypothetical protein
LLFGNISDFNVRPVLALVAVERRVDFAEDETAAVANNRQKVELQHKETSL